MNLMRRFFLLLLLLLPLGVEAVNIRGRVDFAGPGGTFPMNQASVELCHAPTDSCLTYRTGYDGMFYFNANSGPHYIRINGIVRLHVEIPNIPSFDLRPLLGN